MANYRSNKKPRWAGSALDLWRVVVEAVTGGIEPLTRAVRSDSAPIAVSGGGENPGAQMSAVKNGRALPRWEAACPDRIYRGTYHAHTKGEARAQAKRLFGYRGRLPVGWTFERVEEPCHAG